MKKLLYFFALLSLCGCTSDQNNHKESEPKRLEISRVNEIFFELEDEMLVGDEGEESLYTWIYIADPTEDLKHLKNADEIVLEFNEAILLIDYPLENPVEIEIKSKKKQGFTRRELIELISKEYHKIYDEEEKSAQTKTTPVEEREGLINRNKTDGPYGIWGHDLEDLVLSSIMVHRKEEKKPKLELVVES